MDTYYDNKGIQKIFQLNLIFDKYKTASNMIQEDNFELREKKFNSTKYE